MVSRRAKDFYKFLTTVHSFTDGQVKVDSWDSDFMSWVELDITPNDGPYRGATIRFKVSLPSKFPKSPPGLTCNTDVYHPNIDPTSSEDNVCISLMEDWQSSFGLEDCVQGLLFLFYEPNPGDPLSPYFGGLDEEEVFYRHVRLSLTGREIDNYHGPRLIEDDAETEMLLQQEAALLKGNADESADNGEDNTQNSCSDTTSNVDSDPATNNNTAEGTSDSASEPVHENKAENERENTDSFSTEPSAENSDQDVAPSVSETTDGPAVEKEKEVADTDNSPQPTDDCNVNVAENQVKSEATNEEAPAGKHPDTETACVTPPEKKDLNDSASASELNSCSNVECSPAESVTEEQTGADHASSVSFAKSEEHDEHNKDCSVLDGQQQTDACSVDPDVSNVLRDPQKDTAEEDSCSPELSSADTANCDIDSPSTTEKREAWAAEEQESSAKEQSVSAAPEREDYTEMMRKVKELMALDPSVEHPDYSGDEDDDDDDEEYDGHEDEDNERDDDDEEEEEGDDGVAEEDHCGEGGAEANTGELTPVPICRQSSKVERMDTVEASSSNSAESSSQSVGASFHRGLGSHLSHFKTCSFVAPDYDNALLYLSLFLLHSMQTALSGR